MRKGFVLVFVLLTIVIVLIIAGLIIYFQIRPKSDSSGWVNFSVEGKQYHFDKMQFMVRVKPNNWEGEKMKAIPREQKTSFEFSIGPIASEGIKRTKEKAPDFNIKWFLETTDPENALKSKITWQDSELGFLNISSPDWWMYGPEGKFQSAWVQVDELTRERVKGCFGGILNFYWINEEKIKEEAGRGEKEIKDGTFDLPYKKLFKYK